MRQRRLSYRQLQGIKRPHVNVGNASCQTFSRLPKQINGGGTQDEESPGRMAGAPALIDNAAKRVEQLRDAMNFVQYDQAVLILAKEDNRLDQLLPVLSCLQIKIKRSGVRVGNLSRKGRLSNLPWSDNRHSRLSLESQLDWMAADRIIILACYIISIRFAMIDPGSDNQQGPVRAWAVA